MSIARPASAAVALLISVSTLPVAGSSTFSVVSSSTSWPPSQTPFGTEAMTAASCSAVIVVSLLLIQLPRARLHVVVSFQLRRTCPAQSRGQVATRCSCPPGIGRLGSSG